MKRTFAAALTAVLLAGCASTPPMTSASDPAVLAASGITTQPLPADTPTQLPRTARPTHYAIHVVPDMDNLAFSGTTSVDLDVFEPTRTITMNAANLAFTSARLLRADGTGAEVPLTASVDADDQTVTLRAPSQIEPGAYRVDMSYSGKINTQANGLFALDYADKRDGSDKRALFTQFEAPDARRFAPMFDEPSYKATFDLTATVPADMMPVSNMPIAGEEAAGPGLKKVTFGTSPKMSSYLLFFGLGDFERISKMAANNTEVGIVSPTGSGEQARYALDELAPLVGYYNDYFGQPYPLPKLDNIAGPGQSQFFGAMENWGAIFTFERILLVDPAITSAATRGQIYETQAHEVAHQWFGDLVTMAWWDDLWLNEGFASWMATKTTQEFHPEWSPLLTRIGGREAAMGLDSYSTTHPIVQEIRTVEQTNQAFDTITYSKGEAVISMLEAYAGEDVWQKGLQSYMAANKFGNAKTADLWAAIESAGATDLTGIAQDFTTKPGVPLVIVREATCSGGSTNLSLEQSEFSRDRMDAVAASPQGWRIPLLAAVGTGKPVRQVMDGRTAGMTVPGCGPVMLNAGQLGYYRTLYTPQMLGSLITAMPTLAPIDQLGLLRDQLALSMGGYQDVGPALNLLAAVPANANPHVAMSAAGTWEAMYDLMEDDPAAQARIAAMASDRFAPRLKALGFTPKANEPLLDSALRSSLISDLGAMGDESVLAEARRLFAQLETNPKALDGPLKTTWLAIAARNATPAEWDRILKLARGSTSTVEKSTYYTLLGRTNDEELARRALAIAMTEEPGMTTSASIISSVAGSNPELATTYFLDNEAAIAPLIDGSARSSYLARIAGGVNDPALIQRLEAYAKAQSADDAIPLNRTLGFIRERQRSRPRQIEGIATWLGQQ